MIVNQGDLTPEQEKEFKKVTSLADASFPKRVYKYQILAELARQRQAKEKNFQNEKHSKEAK